MKPYQFFALLLLSSFSFAQSVEINPANSSSIITGTATNKGMLVPRMTATERSAISSPANGLLVYQTDGVAGFYFFNGSTWAVLGGGSGSQGPAGLNTLVNTTTEAAGANCTTGGVKLEYGLDANTNNTLDANEVVPALTKYICNGAVGQQGPQGIQGLTGATGSQGAQGIQGPIGATGPAGPTGATGAQGIQGLTGAPGAAGAAGANGKTVLNGTTNPSSGTGTDGDFYINTATNRLFGPKASGTWPGGGVSLVGPTGAIGATGPQGIQGLAGATGQAGPGVPTGGTANQVLAKVDGTDYNTQWVTPSGGSALPPQAGNDGKILVTDGTNANWVYPNMRIMTKAQRDDLVSPAEGTTIYQTDDFPSIYSKQFDGWRSMSSDGPVYIHNVGSPLSAPVPTLTLDASHHTVVVVGTWTGSAIDVINLPDARLCKGRQYRIVVNNMTTTNIESSSTNVGLRTFGYSARVIAPSALLPYEDYSARNLTGIGKNVLATSYPYPGGGTLGDGRATVIMSTGTTWYIVGFDYTDINQIDD